MEKEFKIKTNEEVIKGLYSKEFNLSEKDEIIKALMKLKLTAYQINKTLELFEEKEKEFIKRILDEELEGKDLFIKIKKLAGEKFR